MRKGGGKISVIDGKVIRGGMNCIAYIIFGISRGGGVKI